MRLTRITLVVLYLRVINSQCWAGVIDWTVKKPKVCVFDDKYNKHDTEPTEVAVKFSLVDLYDINEELMQFGLQVFLSTVWNDTLINIKDLHLNKTEDIPEHVMKCIWKPDIIFFNCKESVLFTTTIPNTVHKILTNGLIYHFSRYHITISCQMQFKNYPMDTQTCLLTIQFLSSRNSEASLTWMSYSKLEFCRVFGDVEIFDGVHPQQFWMDNITTGKIEKIYASGNTSQLILKIKFNRYLTASVINTYIPSFLVVCLSFVSFWLDVNAVPGRVTLGVTSLLTLSTQMVSARSALPSVSYMTALDVWLFGCLVLVFVSLVEFTVANSLSRKIVKSNEEQCQTRQVCNYQINVERKEIVERSASFQEAFRNRKCKIIPKSSESQQRLKIMIPRKIDQEPWNLDRFSRIFFPIAMIFFTAAYWPFFLKRSQRL